jgi:uncharacterized protein YcfJ
MSAHLLSVSAEPSVAILAMASTALASVVKKWIDEKFRTRRVFKVLENTAPRERAAIIRAWAQFDGKPVSARPVKDTAGQPRPSKRRPAVEAHDAEQDVTQQAPRGTDHG